MLEKRDQYWYGDSQSDIREEVIRYSTHNGYPAEHFADAACACGGQIFRLLLDDNEGAAVRSCTGCGNQHPIGDSGSYLDDAELAECGCPCGNSDLEITAGVALYENSSDVHWLYLGCRCVQCGLTAVYGDWKNEFEGYETLLRNV